MQGGVCMVRYMRWDMGGEIYVRWDTQSEIDTRWDTRGEIYTRQDLCESPSEIFHSLIFLHLWLYSLTILKLFTLSFCLN